MQTENTMSRKKSRKIGQIGIPKAKEPRTIKVDERPKARKGNKSGTRQQIAESILAAGKKEKRDPRAGSKALIDLSKYVPGQTPVAKTKVEVAPITYKTPLEELNAIEADKELEALLEKREIGKLKSSEQAYVEKLTARYAVLCDLMGIKVDDYDDNIEETEDEDDPFAKLDAIKIDDFKD